MAAKKSKEKPQNPYVGLPAEAFWKTGVAAQSAFEIRGVWTPKFRVLPKHKIVTAGSCFAQHIGRALVGRGYGWFDAEPAPEHLSAENSKAYNYGIFSFRTGNIYSAKALRQWMEWAFGVSEVPDEVWEKDGRFYDPFRPAIEPDGFGSAEELRASREVTFAALRRAVEQSDFFVFTMGLTESWQNAADGFEYAMCPGTLAGQFDPDLHKFHNHSFSEIMTDLKATIRLMRSKNAALRLLLTISPVPLTATASGGHVLTATIHSKSTLRAVAGELAGAHKKVDYFPSYEIITGIPYRSMFFEPNLRGVTPQGVSLVMDNFFHAQETTFGPVKLPGKPQKPKTPKSVSKGDIVCEEEMLNAFAT